MRWGVATRYLKDPATWDCDYCSEHEAIREARNCDWEKPGECKVCGLIPFKDISRDSKNGRFLCPSCDQRITFGKSEFLLGRTYRAPGCPKSHITPRAILLLQLVEWSDTTGKLPTAQTLFDESALFFEIRSFIVSEKNVAELEMEPKEKTSIKRKGSK